MEGNIFNIQRFCTNDGPGIRTTVFFKGCPLRCVWCHNPESQREEKQIMFYAQKCRFCGKCKDLDIQSKNFFCPNDAKEIVGKTVSSDYVVEEAVKDFEFYKTSGGGITISGGEPLFQFDFLLDILKMSKEKKLHTAIETCGLTKRENIIQISEYTDLFLFDIKESNPTLHQKFTGSDNKQILENLFRLNEMGKDVILRCPIIPGYNDRQEHYDEICRLANTLHSVCEINIEPYHKFGENKYEALGMNLASITVQTDEQIQKIKNYMSSKTNKPIKIE